MKSGSSLISDFWWLPENVAFDDLVVGVGHHCPLTDEDEPLKIEWLHSLDGYGRISPAIIKYGFDFIQQWRVACKDTNVYRTLKVFDPTSGEAIFLGPFLVDIDTDDEVLDDAQSVTTQVVKYLTVQLKLSLDDLRIFFSGRKGFNIEIRPEAIRISGPIPDQIRLSSKRLDEIIAVLRKSNDIQDATRNIVSSQGTVIDRIYGDRFGYCLRHPYIRLHDSINKWISGDGKAVARRRIEITYEQLREKSASEISSESEG